MDTLFAPIFDLLIGLAVIGLVLLVIVGAIAFGPRLVGTFRQRAYDRAAGGELLRLELNPARVGEIDEASAVAMVRGLHPRQRRGLDAWRVGWPASELRVVWRDGALAWQVEGHRQVLDEFAVSHRSLHLVLDARPVSRAEAPVAATAVGRLAQSASWPLRVAEVPGDRVLHRLAAALTRAAPPGVEVRLRIGLRPVAPDAWRRAIDPEAPGGPSVGSLIGEAIVDGLLFRESGSGRTPAVAPSPLEREARARKRRGAVGFETSILVEVAGTSFEPAKALLWKLTGATDSLADAGQEIRWRVVAGAVERPPRSLLADWEVAQLWYLPDETFDAADLPRPRPLAGALPASSATAGIVVAANGDRPLAIPLGTLGRHLAVIGATGSGKSTLLLNLVTGLLDTPWGATVIDPHGDLVTDILARIPARHAGRVHLLRLADRAHPRGFNFFERHSREEAQLVTSEFVALFEDLWPRYTGPRMRDILRHGLLTLLSSEGPQTILELDRLLSDGSFRRPYVEAVTDPELANYWQSRWPSRGNDDPSVGAVTNKLGAFIAYDSIRQIVGQGASTLRPREIMDAGDLLLVDLSGVGGDNAGIFGGMLIARFRIEALGRQGTDPAHRRPHLLVVDETPRFSTRALGGILTEGRKFALASALATQTLAAIGPALGATTVANAGTLALLSPGLDDVRTLAPLFAPLTPADLLAMRQHEMAAKMAGPDGRSVVYGGIVLPPGEASAEVATAIAAASDERDARPRSVVEAEVLERLTKRSPAKPATPKDHPPLGRRCPTVDEQGRAADGPRSVPGRITRSVTRWITRSSADRTSRSERETASFVTGRLVWPPSSAPRPKWMRSTSGCSRYVDRAVLRILDRAESALASPTGYPRLRQPVAPPKSAWPHCWYAGLLERATVPPPHRGARPELAYRLSRRVRLRLGDHARRVRGTNKLGHTLDIVDTVCALITAHGDPRYGSPVALWLTEATAATYLGSPLPRQRRGPRRGRALAASSALSSTGHPAPGRDPGQARRLPPPGGGVPGLAAPVRGPHRQPCPLAGRSWRGSVDEGVAARPGSPPWPCCASATSTRRSGTWPSMAGARPRGTC